VVSAAAVAYVATSIALLSAIIHMPVVQLHPLYSDIVAVYQRVFWQGYGWYSEPRIYGLPYLDYFFEYPPLVGIIWSLTTLPRLIVSEPYALLAHYLLQAIVLGASVALIPIEAYKLAQKLGRSTNAYLVLGLPTLVVYGVYNWDALATLLALKALNSYAEDRRTLSGVFFGLAASTKLLPGLAILVLVVEERGRALKTVLVAIAVALLTLAPMIANPTSLADFIAYHSGWYIEGSWWLILAGSAFNVAVREAAKIAMGLAIASSLLLPLRSAGLYAIVKRYTLAMALTLLTSYIYTPQMNVLVTPFIALLLPLRYAALLLAQEVSTCMVIITWFTSPEPLSPLSAPSIASYAKCVLLAIMVSLLLVKDGDRSSRR
jgi:hypothetical protein